MASLRKPSFGKSSVLVGALTPSAPLFLFVRLHTFSQLAPSL